MYSDEPVDVCPECDEGLLFVEDEIEEIVILSCNKCPYTKQTDIEEIK